MKKLPLYLFYLLCGIIGVVMKETGHGLNTWQWWIGCACTWISFQCGRFYQSKD